MGLPINAAPIYNLTVPSTGVTVKYRPFLIKEEKALLLAQQSEDSKVMVDTLKDTIKACVKDDLNTDTLATFDLEYIFTQLRAKSVGEIVELLLRCDTCTDEKAIAKVSIDLTTISVDKSADHIATIPLFDNVGIKMNYPTLDVIQKLQNVDNSDIDQVFDIVVTCIDYIYTDSEIFHAKEQSKEELIEFLNNLSSEQFLKIQKFFETMPRLKHQVAYTCPVCNAPHEKYLEGLNSFF
jgi:T4 bacteriophage base plate protein